MCVKNINRHWSSGASLAVKAEVSIQPPPQAQQQQQQHQQQPAQYAAPQNKQFQCPFCDKSYSWKQTLKQVSTSNIQLLSENY